MKNIYDVLVACEIKELILVSTKKYLLKCKKKGAIITTTKNYIGAGHVSC